jgi:hypothetical protein
MVPTLAICWDGVIESSSDFVGHRYGVKQIASGGIAPFRSSKDC